MTSNDGDAYTKDVGRAFFKKGARLETDTFCQQNKKKFPKTCYGQLRHSFFFIVSLSLRSYSFSCHSNGLILRLDSVVRELHNTLSDPNACRDRYGEYFHPRGNKPQIKPAFRLHNIISMLKNKRELIVFIATRHTCGTYIYI